MKSREFKKIYHPRTGRYVYKHRGNGIIVDNLMKPLKKVASALTGQVLNHLLKKQYKLVSLMRENELVKRLLIKL